MHSKVSPFQKYLFGHKNLYTLLGYTYASKTWWRCWVIGDVGRDGIVGWGRLLVMEVFFCRGVLSSICVQLSLGGSFGGRR